MLYATRCAAAAVIAQLGIANSDPRTQPERQTYTRIIHRLGGPGKLKLISLLGSGLQNSAITLKFSISHSIQSGGPGFFKFYFFYILFFQNRWVLKNFCNIFFVTNLVCICDNILL